MWRNTLTWVFVGLETAAVCVRDFHFSSVPSSLSRESRQTELSSHEPSLSSRATTNSASSILPLSLCLYTCFTAPPPSIPPLLLPRTLCFPLSLLFFSPPRIITFQRRDGIWQGNATHSYLSVFMCQCVCVLHGQLPPIVFPKGWAKQQGVGTKAGGVGCGSKNKTEEYWWVGMIFGECQLFSSDSRVTGVHVSL